MNSFLFLSVLFFISLFSTSKIYADYNYLRSDNPILSPISAWESRFIKAPTMLFNDNKFKLWYTGFDGSRYQIGYAEGSSPTQLSRIPDNNTPVLTWNRINSIDGPEHPYVIFFPPSTYRMWFNSVAGGTTVFDLYTTTSNNGINWSDPIRLVFDIQADWDREDRGAPTVLYDSEENIFKMWYTGFGLLNGIRRWRIGYATSSAGINWIKRKDPVLDVTQSWEQPSWMGGVASPEVIKENDKYYMFYHSIDIGLAVSDDGIDWTKSQYNPILPYRNEANKFDNRAVGDPGFVNINNTYYLTYTAVDNLNRWSIGVATSSSIPNYITPTPTSSPSPTPSPSPTSTPTPTLTPTSTPTPTPTLTPTPTTPPFKPIVIVPGMFASWNGQDIFSCKIENSHIWIKNPLATIYDRLINTLSQNGNMQINKDFYFYTYDWRQPLDKQIEKFKDYLEIIRSDHLPGSKFYLVGHSLGGLLIRGYLANYASGNHVFQAMTVGTPHMGAVDAYPAWAKGQANLGNPYFNIALSTIINTCRVKLSKFFNFRDFQEISLANSFIKTPKDVVQTMVPSVQDLLPVFNYLRKNNTMIDYLTQNYKNNWLINHPFVFSAYPQLTSTLSGNDKATSSILTVINPSKAEKKRGEWLDGKVIGKETTNLGDDTILNKSSQLDGVSNQLIKGNHLEIVYSNEAILKILKFLDLEGVTPAPEVVVPEVVSKDALTVSIDQDATLKLTNPFNKMSDSFDRILLSFSPSIGIYKLTVTPNVTSRAILSALLITKDKDPVGRIYSLKLTKGRKRNFLLTFNPSKPDHLLLIPLK